MPSTAEESRGDASSKPSLRNRIIGLSDWWILQETSRSSKTHILDLRSSEEHEKRCLVNPACGESSVDLVVVPIPISVVEKRSFELPARHVKFSILVSEGAIDRADSFLCGSNRKRSNPWKVVHVLLDTEELWIQAKGLGMVEEEGTQEDHGQQTKRQRTDLEESVADTTKTSKSRKRRFPLARLWQPDPMVETVLFSHLAKLHSANQQSKEPQQVWDLAAGAGRDVAFLAEELLAAEKPYHIVAIDHRYNEKETKIVNDFWDRRGIRNQTTSLKLNLSQWKNLKDAMASVLNTNRVAAMFCVRFWKPDLVKAIVESPSINSGVLFGISHFCRPSVGAPWNFDHPSEKTVLERDQLSGLFQEKWDILHNEIALDSDHGRTMIHFVARRK
mmetsp:Transcript_3634/g.8672  ORF Transcript_3634/g.8672 Transcript_3634/m.8672 type:complete len:389 (-) Transcript_3634:9-1175(-)